MYTLLIFGEDSELFSFKGEMMTLKLRYSYYMNKVKVDFVTKKTAWRMVGSGFTLWSSASEFL